MEPGSSNKRKVLTEKSRERLIDELKAEYSQCSEFFDKNYKELSLEPWSAKSEKELDVLRRYYERPAVSNNTGYGYSSSSIYAAEDVIIELIDIKRYLDSLNIGETPIH